jgi:peptide/nickel transport system substrate-binding protein
MVPNGPDTRQLAEVVQSMAAEAGFDMKIRVTEFATSLNEAEAGRYHAYVLAWSGRADPDGNVYTFMTCAGPNNYSKYCDPEVDAALNAARVVTGQAERKSAYEKAASKALAAGGIIYLYHRPVIIAHSEKLEGYKQLPDGLVRLTGVKLK